MAGGRDEVLKKVEPILMQLAIKDGYVHAGPGGAGHFTKLVHNGIEFGMLQAIGEGLQLLTQYSRQISKLDIVEVLRCWRHGSVIRSWLIDLLEQGFRQNKGISKIPDYIDDTGEVNWLVTDALQLEVPIPAIATSVMQLLATRDGDKDWAKAIEIMRNGFGGHAFGKDPAAQKERYQGRVGDFYRPEQTKPVQRKVG
jgi:6-phosphogluconate dehydrogenase